MAIERLTRREPQIRQPIEQDIERDAPLIARQGHSDTEMDAEAEGHVVAGVGPPKIEAIGVVKTDLIAIAGRIENFEMRTLWNRPLTSRRLNPLF